MKCQFSLTVPEGKHLIARAVVSMPEVRQALAEGLILLKGGTTVSAVSEALGGPPLRISGRISPRGTVSSRLAFGEGAHSVLLRRGVPEIADGRLLEIAAAMGPEDVMVCGANLIDVSGSAAMMAGSAMCGEPGSVVPAIQAEGVFCVVAAGLEKLSPLPVREACSAAGRKAPAWSMGMSVGLVPVPGFIVHELEALRLLGFEKCWLVGRGGLDGARGGATFLAEGDEHKLRQLLDILARLHGAEESGMAGSMPECLNCGPARERHMACVYGGKAGLSADEIFPWKDR